MSREDNPPEKKAKKQRGSEDGSDAEEASRDDGEDEE
jgi:hypothetical protein